MTLSQTFPLVFTADAPALQAIRRFDVDHALIEHLNGECLDWAGMDSGALKRALRSQGDAWYERVVERCPHLFAVSPVFVTTAQLQQMRAVIAAAERVVKLPEWVDENPVVTAQRSQSGNAFLTNPLDSRLRGNDGSNDGKRCARGVFYGYDFHLNEQGAHLIEINTNAGGAFINALLIASQRDAELYGAEVAEGNLEQQFIDMFRNEWRLARGDVPLSSIAIVDEQPESQYLYPEFLLAQRMFEQAGIAAYIADPSALQVREGVLYLGEQKIDLVYNRLTDFSLQHHPVLRQAYLDGNAVVTPDPAHYERYADKRNLARLSDAETLRALGANEADIATLLAGVPQTRLVSDADRETGWQERKHWFFKPATGYGSKGSYSGAKLTKRVFEEIMQGGYVAQRIAAPGERKVCLPDAEPQSLKFDVRCYVYDGQVQLVAARLYQGQTTNFRTPGGGFAVVRVVE
ncbi:MAG: hypothetical protein U1C96_11140 [Gallionella sp.]|nr:hypothetical protein [Gallionella sp.]